MPAEKGRRIRKVTRWSERSPRQEGRGEGLCSWGLHKKGTTNQISSRKSNGGKTRGKNARSFPSPGKKGNGVEPVNYQSEALEESMTEALSPGRSINRNKPEEKKEVSTSRGRMRKRGEKSATELPIIRRGESTIRWDGKPKQLAVARRKRGDAESREFRRGHLLKKRDRGKQKA